MMLLLLNLACYNEVLRFRRVEITGVIESDISAEEGKVYLSAHHAWFGNDILRFPAAEFDSTIRDELGSFVWDIDVPIFEEADGLLIYAWQDQDEDGIFCSLHGTEEYSDLVEVDVYPSFTAHVELTLARLCQPPENLWGENGIPEE